MTWRATPWTGGTDTLGAAGPGLPGTVCVCVCVCLCAYHFLSAHSRAKHIVLLFWHIPAASCAPTASGAEEVEAVSRLEGAARRRCIGNHGASTIQHAHNDSGPTCAMVCEMHHITHAAARIRRGARRRESAAAARRSCSTHGTGRGAHPVRRATRVGARPTGCAQRCATCP